MAMYVKGNAVENAASYELFEKKAGGEMIDFSNPTSAPACWAYDESNKVWNMTDSAYANLRWDVELEAGVAYLFQYTFSELSGGAIATIRDSANTTLSTINTNGAAGTYEYEYTPTESGTYSLRITGTTTPNSGVLSAASVTPVAQEVTYNSLATASEINFDVSEIVADGGTHTFVVKAKADGYEDSDYSNEVVYPFT